MGRQAACSVTDLLIALLAGIGAGFMNAAVGAGTLITFPVMLGLGLPPLAANVTSAVGVTPGNLSGAVTYRSVLAQAHMRGPVITATLAMLCGALVGALLLLALPPSTFASIVPWLIVAAGVLTLVQPWITRRLSRLPHLEQPRRAPIAIGVMLAGTYLSYFGAATGVITLTVLLYAGIATAQEANAIKNVATGIAGVIAAVVFLLFAPVDIPLAIAAALGAAGGGLAGGRIAQKVSPKIYRAAILMVALGAAMYVALVQRA